MPRAVSLYAPPLALMGLIFFLSAQPDLSTGLGWGDLVLRKAAHMTVFASLFLLWLRALRSWPAALAVTFLYAVSDEWHQSFVDGRHGTPTDVLIDMAGVGVAALAVRASRARWR
ncbi:MAG TPA: VanZ family protein [Baekduia sp.]|nr:VanZ family protein [Baekduia sp.]